MKEDLEKSSKVDSYSQQMYQQYHNNPQTHLLNKPIYTYHSDYLNLEERTDGIYTKTKYLQGNIIQQIRGKVAKISDIEAAPFNFGVLLLIDKIRGIVLKPLGISSRILQNVGENGNAELQNHFNSKILVRATEIIPKGEKIIITQESYQNLLFDYSQRYTQT